jgi:hypothetical protein
MDRRDHLWNRLKRQDMGCRVRKRKRKAILALICPNIKDQIIGSVLIKKYLHKRLDIVEDAPDNSVIELGMASKLMILRLAITLKLVFGSFSDNCGRFLPGLTRSHTVSSDFQEFWAFWADLSYRFLQEMFANHRGTLR